MAISVKANRVLTNTAIDQTNQATSRSVAKLVKFFQLVGTAPFLAHLSQPSTAGVRQLNNGFKTGNQMQISFYYTKTQSRVNQLKAKKIACPGNITSLRDVPKTAHIHRPPTQAP